MQTPERSPQPRPRVRLAQARNDRNLSQQEVADQIGTTYVNVSRWERGITRPSPYFRRKLCELFGKQEDELDLLPAHAKQQGAHHHGDTTAEQTASITFAPITPPQPIYDPAIPLKLNTLIGRDHDLIRIKQRLCSTSTIAITALNGLPGVGKTALSITLAHDPEVRAHYKDGILWAGLGPTPNMPGLLSRWGSLLGISQAQMEKLSNNKAWASAIRDAIGERAMLLVIDDAWREDDALAFKVGGPNCAHLVTTRFPVIAHSMGVGGPMMIEELGIEDSINLLDKLAPQAIQREKQRVHELAQAVGGLPLALTLMGNYLRKQAYGGPARRITAALERLNRVEVRMKIEEPHVPAESHPSLPFEQSLSIQSIIAVTDQLLSAEARAALYALSVLPPKPNSFTEETALAVAACDTDILDALADAGMLESTSNERYQLHQVIADYARLQIQDDQLHKAQQHLVNYTAFFIEEHKKDYEQLELESSLIQAALEIASTFYMEKNLIKAVNDYAPFLIMRGFYDQVSEYLSQTYQVADKLDDKYGKANALLYLGEVAQKRGDYARAEANFQNGLQIARDIKNQEQICAFLNDLGDIKWRAGDYRQAENYLQEGQYLSKQIDNLESLSRSLKILGLLKINQSDYKQASDYFHEALAYSQQTGNREQACLLLSNLGVVEGNIGNHIQAEKFFQEGLLLAQQIGHREQICMLLLNLASAAAAQEHYDQANTYLKEGLTVGRQIGYREGITMLLLNLGEVAIAQNNLDEARKYLDETLSSAKQLNRPHITARALREYGELYLRQKNFEEAEKSFLGVITTTAEGNKDLIAMANYGLARVAVEQSKTQKALKLGQESLLILESIGNPFAQEVRSWLKTFQRN